MSLISNFLKKIFGKNDTQTKTPTNNYIPPSTEERDEKINNAQAELKSWLITYLNEHKELDFSWESGNDEAFVSFDGKSYVNHGIFDTLEYHIIDKLNIPDAGEFQMNGNGIIYMTEKSINAKYRSTIKDILDYNEETEEEIYSEEEVDYGDEVLYIM